MIVIYLQIFSPNLVIPPSHRRRGVTAVLVRHKPQWHRRGSAVVPSLIAVALRKNVKTTDLRGGTAETLNMFNSSAVPPRVGPIRGVQANIHLGGQTEFCPNDEHNLSVPTREKKIIMNYCCAYF